MTAEIVLMNKEAIAIAADSAVTLSTTGKVFNYGTKIFPLSEKHQVAIMIYGNMEFMGIPWETLIHLYRTQLGDVPKRSMEEYKQDFMTFLEKNQKFSAESQQKTFFKYFAHECIAAFFEKWKKFDTYLKLNDYTKRQRDKEEVKFFENLIKSLENQELLKEVPDQFDKELAHAYHKELMDVIQEFALDKVSNKTILDYLIKMVIGDACSSEDPRVDISSGVVIAGFGTEDIFPSFHSFKVRMVALNKLIFQEDATTIIDQEGNAAYSSFAQGIEAFKLLYGISDEVTTFTLAFLKKLPELYEKFSPSQKTENSSLLKELTEFSQYLITSFLEAHTKMIEEEMTDPLLAIISVLPKQELAFMVETLVNLASFNRRMSPEPETVGGPIDVALITKAEGFKWIKRKSL